MDTLIILIVSVMLPLAAAGGILSGVAFADFYLRAGMKLSSFIKKLIETECVAFIVTVALFGKNPVAMIFAAYIGAMAGTFFIRSALTED